MRRANISVIAFSFLLITLFGLFATSHIWLPRTPEKDLGPGFIIVGTFILMHVGLTIGVTWSTVLAIVAWHRNAGVRTSLDGIILAVGSVVAISAIAYAVFFMWG